MGTPTPNWGEGPSRAPQPAPRPPRTRGPAAGRWRATEHPPDAAAIDETAIDETSINESGEPQVSTGDPVGWAAVALGCLGIVFLGIVTAVVTGIVAAEAGRRAREERRSAQLAWLALALAFVDGVFFLVVHYGFDLPVWIG